MGSAWICGAPRSATATWSSACARDGYNLGGEQSGHIVLSDYSTTGDGLIAALQVLAVLVQDGGKASRVTQVFEPLPQVLRNVPVADGDSLEDVAVREAVGRGRTGARAGRTLVDPQVRHRARGPGDGRGRG